MKKRNKKKPYIFKKDDAIRLSDPIATFHRKDDDIQLAKLLDENARTTEDATQTDIVGEQDNDCRVRVIR